MTSKFSFHCGTFQTIYIEAKIKYIEITSPTPPKKKVLRYPYYLFDPSLGCRVGGHYNTNNKH